MIYNGYLSVDLNFYHFYHEYCKDIDFSGGVMFRSFSDKGKSAKICAINSAHAIAIHLNENKMDYICKIKQCSSIGCNK